MMLVEMSVTIAAAGDEVLSAAIGDDFRQDWQRAARVDLYSRPVAEFDRPLFAGGAPDL
ncbi:hypothetical protein [Rhizobium mesosinicum]|uniref:Uncharacterized protein n=1 Tax=Rhizobium mesosinicum TaxID=335017 RepID=A0ABS7GZR9_9HYPH|nr:hypothetical protein [Rhizobium mesosinicum]MBW9054609.1 hypothetical protein [Rhizobium mesosinicum]